MFKFVIILAFGWLLAAWSLCVTVGIAHDNWWHLVPPMGGETALVLTLIPFIIGAIIGLLELLVKEL